MNRPWLAICLAFTFVAAACASSSGSGTRDEPKVPPTSFDITVDATSVIGATLHKPYPGAALVDLRNGERIEIVKEQDLEALEQPVVWLEPTDPEVHFSNVTLVTSTQFHPDKRGGQLDKAVVKVGTVALVAGPDGQGYRVEIKAYTPGDRKTAALTVHISRTKVTLPPLEMPPPPLTNKSAK